jgi:hypothetical protein
MLAARALRTLDRQSAFGLNPSPLDLATIVCHGE